MSGSRTALLLNVSRCAQPHCNVPDISCNLGEEDYRACSYWQARAGSVAGGTTDRTVEDVNTQNIGSGALDDVAWQAPWSGSALGITDLDVVTARGPARVVALVGPHNAGKTTLLGAAYLMLSRTGHVGANRFAGSYTLGGWEAVAHGMRWRPDGAPGFPPHTPRGAGRAPGLLHLALRGDDRPLADVLVTDAPGEWFTRWAYDRDAADAVGARWIARHSDAFIVMLDSDALAGENRGDARRLLIALAQRVGAEAGERPVAAVWTKADCDVPMGIRDTVENALNRFLPDSARFAVTVRPPGVKGEAGSETHGGFLDVLEWGVHARKRALSMPKGEVPPSASTPLDAFLAFRTRTSTGDGAT